MRVFLAVFILLIFVGCSAQPRASDVLIRVNGKSITVREYVTLFENLKPKELNLIGKERAEMKNMVIKTLVRRSVILTEAERRNIHLTEEELKAGLERIKSGYTPSAFEEGLLEQMVDEKDWKERMSQSLLIEKMFDASQPPISKPSLKEALNYYNENQSLFRTGEEVSAQHIVVNDEKTAEMLRDKWRKQPSSFLSLAKEYSTGPEASTNGQINVEKETLPEELDRVLFESPIGRISSVIQSPYGFHIIKVLSRRSSLNLDFEQVKNEILKILAEEQRRAWVHKFEEHLIRSATIEYNRELIAKL